PARGRVRAAPRPAPPPAPRLGENPPRQREGGDGESRPVGQELLVAPRPDPPGADFVHPPPRVLEDPGDLPLAPSEPLREIRGPGGDGEDRLPVLEVPLRRDAEARGDCRRGGPAHRRL